MKLFIIQAPVTKSGNGLIFVISATTLFNMDIKDERKMSCFYCSYYYGYNNTRDSILFL